MIIGGLVVCVRGCPDLLEKGETYRVAVVVTDWIDYQGHHTGEGYILVQNNTKYQYPYVWDADRFSVVEGEN